MSIEAFDQALEHLPRRLIETNPVAVMEFLLQLGPSLSSEGFCARRDEFTLFLETLAQEGIALPAEAILTVRASGLFLGDEFPNFRRPEPRVVGLAVSVGPIGRDYLAFPRGLVMPLRVAPSRNGRWVFHFGLPFDERLTDHLGALASASEMGDSVVTERLAFELSGGITPYGVRGESMDIAALLAILDYLHGGNLPLFRAACAVIAPTTDAALDKCGYTKRKLAAFVREFGRGSLLVRHPDDTDAACYDPYFDTVAQVASWRDLADFLSRRPEGDLLAPITRRAPLSPLEVRRIDDRANGLLSNERRYDRARNLVERALRLGFSGDVPIADRQRLHQRLVGAFNLQGCPQEAARVAAEILRETEALHGDAASWEDLCRAATPLAAAYWNLHQFNDAAALLAPWVVRIEDDPRRVSVEARVRVFNTTARALAALDADPGRWEILFQRSLRLQDVTRSSDWCRTAAYLIHARLRHNQFESAETLLRAALARVESDDTRLYLRAHEADLARRRGDVWTDEALDESIPSQGILAFPRGLYFVATARQAGRSRDDVLARLGKARLFFACVRLDQGLPSLAEFIQFLVELLEAVVAEDTSRAGTALDRIRVFFSLCPNVASWYEPVWRTVQAAAIREHVEAMFARVPYF